MNELPEWFTTFRDILNNGEYHYNVELYPTEYKIYLNGVQVSKKTFKEDDLSYYMLKMNVYLKQQKEKLSKSGISEDKITTNIIGHGVEI